MSTREHLPCATENCAAPSLGNAVTKVRTIKDHLIVHTESILRRPAHRWAAVVANLATTEGHPLTAYPGMEEPLKMLLRMPMAANLTKAAIRKLRIARANGSRRMEEVIKRGLTTAAHGNSDFVVNTSFTGGKDAA